MIVTYKVTCLEQDMRACGGDFIIKVSDDYIEPECCIWCGGPVESEIEGEEEEQ